jgi:hypothetical protein
VRALFRSHDGSGPPLFPTPSTAQPLPPGAWAQDAATAAGLPDSPPLGRLKDRDEPGPGPQGPPANLWAGAFQTLVDHMWQASPTFRRQSARLGTAPALTVTVRAESVRTRSDIRAFTIMRREKATLVAAGINLLAVADAVELIAHEIEHVIEQLDGVELRHDTCGRRHGAGVETCRAIQNLSVGPTRAAVVVQPLDGLASSTRPMCSHGYTRTRDARILRTEETAECLWLEGRYRRSSAVQFRTTLTGGSTGSATNRLATTSSPSGDIL